MKYQEILDNIGSFLSVLLRVQLMEPHISQSAIENILSGFPQLSMEQQAEFATGMLKYLNRDYSEGEIVLKSREIMAEVLGKLEC